MPIYDRGMNAEPRTVLVERGDRIESVHRVSGVAVTADGRVIDAFGDIDTPIFPRSALKPFQAHPLVGSGAAARFGLSEESLAVACASHSGEPAHVEAVRTLLAASGSSEDDLGCGTHPPIDESSARRLLEQAEASSALHHNCSGKHAGMLAVSRYESLDVATYLDRGHGVQRAIAEAIVEFTGWGDLDDPARDGCSAPAWAMPLRNVARGYAQLDADDSGRALFDAMVRHPFLVAGTGRPCTALMGEVGDIIAKSGAEGVFGACCRSGGVGVAIKVHDGATRASSVALIALLDRLGVTAGVDSGPIAELRAPLLRNANDTVVGSIVAGHEWQA